MSVGAHEEKNEDVSPEAGSVPTAEQLGDQLGEETAASEEQHQALAALMKEVQPVPALLLVADGSVKQVTLDLSPRANGVATLLGGQAEFIGAFYQSDVFLLQRQRSEEQGLPRSTHRLPAPFTNYPVFGDALVVRMDENSDPKPLLSLEWLRLLETSEFDSPDEDADEDEAASDSSEQAKQGEDDADAEDGDGEDEEDVSDGEGGVSAELVHAHLLARIAEEFESEHGREPSVDEIKDVLRNILAHQNGQVDDEDDDEDQEEVPQVEDEEDDEEDEYTPKDDPEADEVEADNKRSLSEMQATDEANVDAEQTEQTEEAGITPSDSKNDADDESEESPTKRRRTASARDVSEVSPTA
ncbi:MAG: hypothetical protein MHM6MM_007333 [Cercozoa sp. M6MM]